MKQNYKIILVIAILLAVVFLIYFDKQKTHGEIASETEQEQPAPPSPQIRYFSQSSDKVVIYVGTQTLYTDNPTTTLIYYAVDNSDKKVHFRDSDRAFVRILGITHLFSDNIEIFHPELDGVKDYTIFSGNISILEQGTYLVKVCLGGSINLDSEGNMIWPFGCFEDETSVQMNVYKK